MKSILEEIYYGEKSFCEKIEPGEEYDKLYKEFYEIFKKLENYLNDEKNF